LSEILSATRATAVVFFLASICVLDAHADDKAEFSDGATVSFEGVNLVFKMDGKTSSIRILDSDSVVLTKDLSIHSMAGGVTAMHVRLGLEGGGRHEAVAVREDGKRIMKPVWSESVTPMGDTGERVAWGVRFVDLSGDGLPEIVVGRTSEAVRLCTVDNPPLLFREVYDLGSSRLRSIAARRPGLGEAKELTGRVEPAGSSPVALLRTLVPTGVSHMAGDRNDPILLTPPAILVDGDDDTAWFPGNGNGAGEFATFFANASAYGITKIGILPARAGRKTGKLDQPATILLAAGDQVFRLVFPSQSGTRETIWFEFPKPVHTDCVSLIMETSFNSASGRPVALSEIVVLTEVDSPGGLARLAADLSSDVRGEQAVALLRGIGKKAVEPISAVWSQLDTPGRRRAVRVLAEAGPVTSVEILAQAAVDDDEILSGIAARAIERAGDAGVTAMVGYLDSANESRFEKATRLLAGLSSERAVTGLISVAGKGGRDRRKLLRELIGRAATRSSEHAKSLWAGIEKASKSDDNEQVLDLMRAAIAIMPLKDSLVELAGSMYAESTDFDDRFRLLDVIAALSGPVAVECLHETLGDPDHILRAVAVSGLSLHPDDEKAKAGLEAALADEAPQVRLAALEAFTRLGSSRIPSRPMIRLINDDPWPVWII
jgi:HEAT repeat protein